MSEADGSVRVCPNCAGAVHGRFCPTCGIDLECSSDNPWAEPPEGGTFRAEDYRAEDADRSPGSRRVPVFGIVAGVAAAAVVAVLGAGLISTGVSGVGVATTTSVTEESVDELPTSADPSLSASQAPSPTASTATPVNDALPSGLYCRDLWTRGVSYPDAVTYWQQEGTPARMDADRNDIPCETVYPRADVIEFWGEVGWDSAGGYLGALPSGLYCRDLVTRKLDYPEAVAYWLSQGMPDRMDEDLNGIPCEIVYREAVIAEFWGH